MYDVLGKISCIETIEVTHLTSIVKIWYSVKLYHYKAGCQDKLQLGTALPLEFNTFSEVRGFLKGLEIILGAEFFVTKIEPPILHLNRWTKIDRDQIKVCFQNDCAALTPQNLPYDIFSAETVLKFLKSDS